MASAGPPGGQGPGGGGGSPAAGPKTQGSKSRRKISLPWFRQNSLTPGRAFLTRQHTIDTPSAFQARLLNRQPSHAQCSAQPSLHTFALLLSAAVAMPVQQDLAALTCRHCRGVAGPGRDA
ncbi:Methionine aminopeptidase 2-1 [Frankliniella fusca]|uniref:Methionine aminopeptidase 2-1 n=1 Tax=Frankliniella fusca TaxID=407009 RepID=A0AAE1I4C8_9NEOP|nr:Methionine aminopeptidase 2-1 [Frankliniella fusca]